MEEEVEDAEAEEEEEEDDGTVAIHSGYTDVRGQPMPSISTRNTSITRRLRTQSNESRHMPFGLPSSLQSKSKPYGQTPLSTEYSEEDDDEGYTTGDAVDVITHNAWNRGIITQNMDQRVMVRIAE
eukprot:1059169_1